MRHDGCSAVRHTFVYRRHTERLVVTRRIGSYTVAIIMMCVMICVVIRVAGWIMH